MKLGNGNKNLHLYFIGLISHDFNGKLNGKLNGKIQLSHKEAPAEVLWSCRNAIFMNIFLMILIAICNEKKMCFSTNVLQYFDTMSCNTRMSGSEG